MTQLRKKMLEELQRRNYSHRTAKTYVRIIREFAEHFHQPPDKLGPEHIRQYQAHLFQAKKLGHREPVRLCLTLLVHQKKDDAIRSRVPTTIPVARFALWIRSHPQLRIPGQSP